MSEQPTGPEAAAETAQHPSPASLPAAVKRVEIGEKKFFLVGTAHVSKKSVEDVREAISVVEPETVCVELCASRYANIKDREQWKKTNVVKIVREGKAHLLLASLIMTSFQRRIAKRLGVEPGAEMIEGIRQAKEREIELVLADRDIQITLKRTWRRLGFKDKAQMLLQLLASLFITEEIDEELIEELKKEEKLTDVLGMLAEEFPMVKSTLIDERDVYLAQKIRQAPGRRVLAVVGAGHVPGILEALASEQELEALEELPARGLAPRVLQWSIPLVIIALLAYGFYRGGWEHSVGSITIWVGVNGTLAALGAAAALGHPLAILAAFLAAPLTSLNPLLAAGWFAGLAQAIVKKPTVEDLEELPEAITSLKGFWKNPASRILLVVVFANLGSALATFISGSWIAARLFQ